MITRRSLFGMFAVAPFCAAECQSASSTLAIRQPIMMDGCIGGQTLLNNPVIDAGSVDESTVTRIQAVLANHSRQLARCSADMNDASEIAEAAVGRIESAFADQN